MHGSQKSIKVSILLAFLFKKKKEEKKIWESWLIEINIGEKKSDRARSFRNENYKKKNRIFKILLVFLKFYLSMSHMLLREYLQKQYLL